MAKDYSVKNIGYPVREKNSVLPLINGEEAWRMVYDHIVRAKKTIHLCFWMMDDDLEMIRDEDEVFGSPEIRSRYTLYWVLNEKSVADRVEVRILLWDFAPLDDVVSRYAGLRGGSPPQWIEPRSRRIIERNRVARDAARRTRNKVRASGALGNNTFIRKAGEEGRFEVLYQPHPHTGSWHQKTIIIDDSIAFVGGMNAQESYWDTSDHLAFDLRRAKHRHTADERRWIAKSKYLGAINNPYHDYMTLIKGPIVSDVQSNFVERWNYCVSQKLDYYSEKTHKLPMPQPSDGVSDVKAQIVRTIPPYEPQRLGEKGIVAAYVKAISNAEQYIYIENQYFRSVTLAEKLVEAAERGVKIIIVIHRDAFVAGVPPVPRWVNVELADKSFDILRNKLRNSLFFLQAFFKNNNGKGCFVTIDLHAKLMIVDDEWYTIGSCNINDAGFETEGELNVSVQHSSAKDLRARIFSLHLRQPCPEDIKEAFKLWDKDSGENYKAWQNLAPPKSFVFPFNPKTGLFVREPTGGFAGF